MITEQTARDMMQQLSALKKQYSKTKSESSKVEYFEFETKCIETLKYFVDMKAGKYRKFSNHSDLSQDGLEALLKAIRTFKLKDLNGNNKGSFFFWAGLFVNTKLVRSANNHTTIRYPMHYAKKNKPHKENTFPILLDSKNSPEKTYEKLELESAIHEALEVLSDDQKEIIDLVYGFSGDKPMSITRICEKKKISRSVCTKIINEALDLLKNKIKI